MTDAQRKTLRVLADLVDRGPYCPTVRELAAERGLGVSVTHGHLRGLRRDGLVTWKPASPRTLTVTAAGLTALIDGS